MKVAILHSSLFAIVLTFSAVASAEMALSRTTAMPLLTPTTAPAATPLPAPQMVLGEAFFAPGSTPICISNGEQTGNELSFEK